MPTFDGIPVTTDSMPAEARRSVPITLNENDFKARLRDGGTIELINTVWRIGEGPSYGQNTSQFFAADVLILKNASIVTNGNTLALFVNRLVSNNGKILSFADTDKKAATGANATSSGQAGRPGNPGDSGGAVSIHVIQELEGTIAVDLSGQEGGNGGDGAKGSRGIAGVKGDSAVSDGLWCRRGGQDGSQGGPGNPGGNAGDGGPGGQGGTLFLFQVNKDVGEGSYSFVANGGEGGFSGQPGEGGDGGPGGEGGNGSGACGGGHGGKDGSQGSSGEKNPNRGAKGGDGNVLAKSINIEVATRLAASGIVLPDPRF